MDAAAILMLVASPTPVTAQTITPADAKPATSTWTPKLTADGNSDVQGFWLTVVYGTGG